VTRNIKTLTRICNLIEEIGLEKNNQALLFNDNKAMINFVHGEGTAKGVRRMERRIWYTRKNIYKEK
jgi:hypothetical protein